MTQWCGNRERLKIKISKLEKSELETIESEIDRCLDLSQKEKFSKYDNIGVDSPLKLSHLEKDESDE